MIDFQEIRQTIYELADDAADFAVEILDVIEDFVNDLSDE